MNGSEAAGLQPGLRLSVPFGRRKVTGYLVEVCEDSDLPQAKLKHADALLDTVPLVPPTLLQLCDWAARYYHHPAAEVGCRLPAPAAGKAAPARRQPGWRLTTGAWAYRGRVAQVAAAGRGAGTVANCTGGEATPGSGNAGSAPRCCASCAARNWLKMHAGRGADGASSNPD